jgi:hypothetical protein
MPTFTKVRHGPSIRQRMVRVSLDGATDVSKDDTVPISIVRVGDLYEATVSPPHGRSIAWTTPQPLAVDALAEELRNRGCHQTDIGDGFYDADPEWLLR